MADISKELAAIMAAVLGEQVRGSIHDAIKKINDVSEKVIDSGTAINDGDPNEGAFLNSLYINTQTDELLRCNGTNWVKVANIRGNGIQKITGPESVGLVDTYTIIYTDGNNKTFTVTNGVDGIDGIDGAQWYKGTALSGTSASVIGFPGKVNDCYLNGVEGHIYTCVREGGASGPNAAVWEYVMSLTGGGSVAVIDNLENTSVSDALSANQGRVLNQKKINKPSTAEPGQILGFDGEEWGAVDGFIMLPNLIIETEEGANVTVQQPNDTIIEPTFVNDHWECELSAGYGNYTIHSVLPGTGDATRIVKIDTVKVYSVKVVHYDFTINVTAPNGSTIKVTDGEYDTQVVSGTGSPLPIIVHQPSVEYDIIVELIKDGNQKTNSTKIMSPTITGQSRDISLPIEFGTITVEIDIDLIIAGSTINCTCGDMSCTSKLANNTLEFNPPEIGVWRISAILDGKTYYVDANVESLDEPVNVKLISCIIYGFHVNSTVSDSDNCVDYQVEYDGRPVENYSFTPGHMDFTNDVFDYGSWTGDEFFFPRPVLYPQDYLHDSKIYLNPNDLTKDVDNNDVTDLLTGVSGNYNAMMEWGRDDKKIWYKLVPDATPTSYTVYISDKKIDDGFVAWSFYDANDSLADHFYTAIYNGTVDDTNALRSLSGKALSTSGLSGAVEIAYAKENNKNGEEYAWYVDVFADRLLINFLTVLIIKSLNCETKIGTGNYTGGSASTLLATGLGNDKGLFYGKTSNSVCKVFGIENYYANIGRRYAGLNMNASGVFKYKLTYGVADGSTSKGYHETTGAPSNYLTGNTISTSLSGSYIKAETASENGVLLPSTFAGTSSTYYADAGYTSTTAYPAVLGGDSGNTSICGLFAFRFSYSLTSAAWRRGSNLSCKPISV